MPVLRKRGANIPHYVVLMGVGFVFQTLSLSFGHSEQKNFVRNSLFGVLKIFGLFQTLRSNFYFRYALHFSNPDQKTRDVAPLPSYSAD